MFVVRPLQLAALVKAARLRRGIALLACVGVLGWALLSATHWHEPSDLTSGQHGAAECVLCLGSATAATPPELAIVHLLPPSAAVPAAVAAPRAALVAAPSSYQSRAPPAA